MNWQISGKFANYVFGIAPCGRVEMVLLIMKKSEIQRDEQREQRIAAEAIVDVYGAEEQAMGWYYYLEERIQFPVTEICAERRMTSPLRKGDQIDVLRMAPEEECEREIFFMIQWEKDGLGVPLSQLLPIDSTDDETIEAVEDWHYWVKVGYEF